MKCAVFRSNLPDDEDEDIGVETDVNDFCRDAKETGDTVLYTLQSQSFYPPTQDIVLTITVFYEEKK